MPLRAPRGCRRGGCPHMRPCPLHDVRVGPRQRGYDAEYEEARKEQLAREPWCWDHLQQGQQVQATVAHHVGRGRARQGDHTKLMSLCEHCHNSRTARGE